MSLFDDIKPGDLVVVPGGISPGKIVPVERVTKTQFTANGKRWLKPCGTEVGTAGDPWHFSFAIPLTPRLQSKIEAWNAYDPICTKCDRLSNMLQARLKELRQEARQELIQREQAPVLLQAATHIEAALNALNGLSEEGDC
jgi:hypothetical protein